MALINFFTEDISFKLAHPRKTSNWIKKIIKREKSVLVGVSYIFCSDEHLRQTNIQYLNHKTYTDIITFDYSGTPGSIEGDIFISIDRVKDNSEKFKRPFDEELHRVMIHGVLHLLGFSDKTAKEKALIHKKEDACLSLR